MKQSIPTPVVIAVIALIVIVLGYFAYTKIIAPPGASGPYKERSADIPAPPGPPPGL